MEDEVFNLNTMQPYNLKKILTEFRKVTEDIVLYLPRTSNLNQIADFAKDGDQVPVVHYCMNGASKVSAVCFWSRSSTHRRQALCAYFGKFDPEYFSI
jgi:trimethylguanosine synthase